MEIKDMKGKIEEMKQEKSELSKEKDELIKENEKIKAYKERNMKSNSEYITETIKTKMKIKENQTQIDGGMAIAALLKSDKRVNLDLSYFNSSSPLVSNEDYKKAREKMLEFILYELRHEIAIVKFTSRGMMKIVEGDEYEKAIQVNADADWVNFKLDRANKIINDYGNDIKSLIKDAMDGKENLGDISKEFSSIIENAVKTFVNEKLSSSMDKPRNDLRADVFPVKTEIDGELVNVMISFISMSASLRRNLEYVKATVYGSERTLSIPICEALRFLTMELIDNTIDSKMRTEFRNSINYEKIDMETGNATGNKITLVHFNDRDKKK
jgi:regulator of replication initiation timing